MTIKLDSGLSVRITNDQLIVPERTISPTGEIVANASSPNMVINPIKEINANDQLHLGRQFLSGAYVLLNEDSSSFTLWKANPTFKESLMAVDQQNNPITTKCEVRVTMSGESKLSKGAIAGIAVGTIAAVIIIALVAYRASKKNDRKKQRTWSTHPLTDGAAAQAQAKTGPEDIPLQNLSTSELDVYSPRTPNELSAEPEFQELVELPARNSTSEGRLKPKS